MVTLCIATLMIIGKCFVQPDAYDKLKDLIMVLIGGFIATVTTIVTAYFNRTDRETITGSGVAKLVLAAFVVGLLGFAAPAVHAEESTADSPKAFFAVGNTGIEFWYPLQKPAVIALYDFWKGEGLLGAETSLVTWKAIGINYGAITSFTANGMPFVSLDCDIAQLYPSLIIPYMDVGVWYGHDFKSNDNRAGVKGSKRF
jgi:hypothetical protein